MKKFSVAQVQDVLSERPLCDTFQEIFHKRLRKLWILAIEGGGVANKCLESQQRLLRASQKRNCSILRALPLCSNCSCVLSVLVILWRGVLLIGEKGEAWIRNDLLSGKSKPLKRGSLVCCRAVLSYIPTHVPPFWPFCSINRKSSSCLLRGKTQTLHVYLPSAEQRKHNFLRLFTRTVWQVLLCYSSNSKFPLLALSNK